MKFQPIHRSRIVAALQEEGPMTAKEIAEYLGMPKETVNSCISSTRFLLPEQVFRVVRHQPVIGYRGRDLAVYAAEAGPDATHQVNRPARKKQAEARYRKKHRATINARGLIASMAPVNPWMQLAPPEIRGVMTIQARP
ncbi:ArsR family transcriptional regulator [Comamonas testosteroni]|uniref:ArsR family transcriptional regulator n=1 Tax=Comamonas testosteroni TaxID=285 RepID=UPI0006B8F791|nr:ArsR family transcriptional regulator [Comamonas testosteroni]